MAGSRVGAGVPAALRGRALVGARVVVAGVVSAALVVSVQAPASAGPTTGRGATTNGPMSTTAPAWRDTGASHDVAVSGYGAGDGYHVQLAREAAQFAWADRAVIRPAGLDESIWYGYQCLSGDGTHVAVTVLPGSLVNLADARERGAYAYSVDVASGAVTPLLSGVSFEYSSPGCGTASRATFTSSLPGESVTSVAVVDLASGKVTMAAVVPGQLTSVVPVGERAMGVLGGTLVSVGAGGTDVNPTPARVETSLTGQGFAVRAASDGGVDLLVADVASQRSTVQHWTAGRLTQQGAGTLADVQLAAGRSGHNTIFGLAPARAPKSTLRTVVAAGLAAPSGVVSLDGDAVFGVAPGAKKATGEPLSQVISTQTQEVLSVGKTSSNPSPGVTTATSGRALQGIAFAEPFVPQAQFYASDVSVSADALTSQVSPASTVTATRMALASGSPSVAASASSVAATTPRCAVARLDPARQALQPSPAQVNWAAQMAAQGLLRGSAYTRPANFANMGMAAYAPSSDFPRIALHHPVAGTSDTVPRSVMEAIMAQESNWNQASWHALPGMAGAPLIGNYYGTAGSIRTIDYSKADCGYGVAQVTSGMAASETSIAVNGKSKVAVDYEENIAAGLRILQQSWNTLYDAGITANGGDPTYLENWYLAIWAYNSGIQPGSAYGNTTGCTPSATCTGPDGTWGLGWSNNPANAAYPPNRTAFLRTTLADASHPGDWPYQERVMGWMASPLVVASQAAYAKPDYHGGSTWIQIPAGTTFCTSGNLCDPVGAVCTLADLECWWHQPVTWVANCSTACATSAFAYATGSTEPTYASPYPPTCNVDAKDLPTTASGAPIIVDDLADPTLNRQGCTALNWSTSGTFAMAYGTNAAGDATGQIDTHQIGAGFGGHLLFTHTQAAGDAAVINTGTWTPALPTLQNYTVKVHLPAIGASATDAVYSINPGGGVAAWQIRVNQAAGSEKWVTLGTFAMQNGGNVQLSNASSMTPSVYDVAYDAIAFLPQGGAPAQVIGGPATVSDAP